MESDTLCAECLLMNMHKICYVKPFCVAATEMRGCTACNYSHGISSAMLLRLIAFERNSPVAAGVEIFQSFRGAACRLVT